MPSITQVNVGDTTYDIKDPVARSALGIIKKEPDAIGSDYGLETDGTSAYDTSFQLLKYQVTQGQKIHVVALKPGQGRASCIFQSAASVQELAPNPNLISSPITTAINGILTVPNGATWVIIASPKNSSLPGIYKSGFEQAIQGSSFSLQNYGLEKIEPYEVVNGYKLVQDGRCAADDSYKLIKFRVTPGKEYYARGFSSNGGIVYQFQPYAGVSTTSSIAVGTPCRESVEGMVSPESGTYYMIMSAMVNDTLTGLYTFKDNNRLVPSYWKEYLNTVAFPKFYNNLLNIGNHGVSFLFFTDVHENTGWANLVNTVHQEIHGDAIVNGGDLINGSTSKSDNINTIRKLMKEIPNQKQYLVRGNHDANTNFSESTSDNEISESEFYALCMKPVENMVISNGELYYYFDNTNQKVRYIVLDTGAPDGNEISNEQIAWMVSRITELSSDWTVVIFAHMVYTKIDDIAVSGEKITEALDALTTGAKIACVVSGHTHKDQSYIADGGYPIIITTAMNAWQESKIQGDILPRTYGTITEFAFDTFFIDTQNRTINVVRIGAGTDRTFTY